MAKALTLKEKLEARKKKTTTKTKKADPAKKRITKKASGGNGNGTVKGKSKPIRFNLSAKDTEKIEKSFEKIQEYFDQCGEYLNNYLYEGKKKSAAEARSATMDIIKEIKNIRIFIQDSKNNLEPVYKDAS